MPKKWSELRAESKLTEEQLKTSRRDAEHIAARMRLDDLRRARNLSQEQLAETLGIDQAAVSRLERRSDLYLSTLRRFIHAVGGTMRITVEFPDAPAEIELEMLGDIEPSGKRTRPRKKSKESAVA